MEEKKQSPEQENPIPCSGLPEEEETYTPRSKSQLLAARIGLVVFILFVIWQIWQIYHGFQ